VLGSGNVGAAKGMTVDAIDETRLTDAFSEFERHGALLGDINNSYGGKMHSLADIEVTSEMKFERATRLFTGHWNLENGPPRLTEFAFSSPPSTQPGK
jgi:hypothetical protein